jgi:hypothetical protein
MVFDGFLLVQWMASVAAVLVLLMVPRVVAIWLIDGPRLLGSKFRQNSGRNSGSGPKSGIFGHGVAGITFIKSGVFRQFLIKETEMRHRCDIDVTVVSSIT